MGLAGGWLVRLAKLGCPSTVTDTMAPKCATAVSSLSSSHWQRGIHSRSQGTQDGANGSHPDLQ